MAAGRVRKLFPGGNTSSGFHSFYNYIIPPDATRILVIKGGPGVGKSTFMKFIGEKMVAQGYDAEHHCCSSDNGSLDGVVFPAFGVAMLDGTAPHVVDPKNPGAVDEIIHLGDYWDEAGMRRNKEPILQLNAEVGRLFRRAYGCLAQAKLLKDEIESYYQDSHCLDMAAFHSQMRSLLEVIFSAASDQRRPGKDRHLFASAITPDGPVNHFGTLFNHLNQRFVVTGGTAALRYALAARMAQEALSLGYDVEVLHCSLEHSQVEHVIIPALGAALITSSDPHRYQPFKGDPVLDLMNVVDDSRLNSWSADLNTAREHYHTTFSRAVQFIARAKAVHDDMETYYVPNMKFDLINARRAEILQRIQDYAQEGGAGKVSAAS